MTLGNNNKNKSVASEPSGHLPARQAGGAQSPPREAPSPPASQTKGPPHVLPAPKLRDIPQPDPSYNPPWFIKDNVGGLTIHPDSIIRFIKRKGIPTVIFTQLLRNTNMVDSQTRQPVQSDSTSMPPPWVQFNVDTNKYELDLNRGWEQYRAPLLNSMKFARKRECLQVNKLSCETWEEDRQLIWCKQVDLEETIRLFMSTLYMINISCTRWLPLYISEDKDFNNEYNALVVFAIVIWEWLRVRNFWGKALPKTEHTTLDPKIWTQYLEFMENIGAFLHRLRGRRSEAPSVPAPSPVPPAPSQQQSVKSAAGSVVGNAKSGASSLETSAAKQQAIGLSGGLQVRSLSGGNSTLEPPPPDAGSKAKARKGKGKAKAKDPEPLCKDVPGEGQCKSMILKKGRKTGPRCKEAVLDASDYCFDHLPLREKKALGFGQFHINELTTDETKQPAPIQPPIPVQTEVQVAAHSPSSQQALSPPALVQNGTNSLNWTTDQQNLTESYQSSTNPDEIGPQQNDLPPLLTVEEMEACILRGYSESVGSQPLEAPLFTDPSAASFDSSEANPIFLADTQFDPLTIFYGSQADNSELGGPSTFEGCLGDSGFVPVSQTDLDWQWTTGFEDSGPLVPYTAPSLSSQFVPVNLKRQREEDENRLFDPYGDAEDAYEGFFNEAPTYKKTRGLQSQSLENFEALFPSA